MVQPGVRGRSHSVELRLSLWVILVSVLKAEGPTGNQVGDDVRKQRYKAIRVSGDRVLACTADEFCLAVFINQRPSRVHTNRRPNNPQLTRNTAN